jgi:hypothetical protein
MLEGTVNSPHEKSNLNHTDDFYRYTNVSELDEDICALTSILNPALGYRG